MVTDIWAVLDCMGLLLSVTVTAKVELPALVGVPERTPVAALRTRFEGSDPPEMVK